MTWILSAADILFNQKYCTESKKKCRFIFYCSCFIFLTCIKDLFSTLLTDLNLNMLTHIRMPILHTNILYKYRTMPTHICIDINMQIYNFQLFFKIHQRKSLLLSTSCDQNCLFNMLHLMRHYVSVSCFLCFSGKKKKKSLNR